MNATHNRPPAAKALREALKLPSTYTVDQDINAPLTDDPLNKPMRRVYRLTSPTAGMVAVYAAWMVETGVVEITESNFKEIAARALGINK
jgi:hypothetical protein